MPTITVIDPDYRPAPEEIDATEHLWEAFNHVETETSARWLLRFAQARMSGWAPFTLAEIEAFYANRRRDGFTFNRLLTGGWIVRSAHAPDADVYLFTADFVRRCYESIRKSLTDTGRS